MSSETPEPRWILLIHQLPPKPDYFRVKIWRRLQRLGAVAIKNSVYVLPRNDQTYEDFQWVMREIAEGGGDASICEARFVDGLSDGQVAALFNAARDADYAQLATEVRALFDTLPVGKEIPDQQRRAVEAQLTRLSKRFSEITAIDFLKAPGREAVDGLFAGIEQRFQAKKAGVEGPERKNMRGRTWVTRQGIHIDRMASAWLIRRFIDPKAKLKFVQAKGYRPKAGEVRFDMFDAEYTHEGDQCTFEVLIRRFGLDDHALQPLAEIVHDIDLKDSKFGRPDAAGIDRLIAGITMAHKADEDRLTHGTTLFDGLYEYYRRKKS